MNIATGSFTFARRKRACIIKDADDEEAIIFSSWWPGTFLRYSQTFMPTIFGEYNTAGKTIRRILQDIANNYLAYIRIDSDKKGYFVRRTDYLASGSIEIKPDYVKGRITERLYNEKYDSVKVTASGTVKEYGDMNINKKQLSVTLDLIPPDYAEDFAKYFLDYYAIERKLMKIKYLPTMFEFVALDEADLSQLYAGGGVVTGRIHKAAPRKIETQFEVLINQE